MDLSTTMQFTVWSIPPFVTALVAVAAARRTTLHEEVPGVFALRFLFSLLIFWAGGQTLGSLLTGADAKFLIQQITFIGLAMVPVAWFMFCLTYSRRIIRVSRRTLNATCLLPCIGVILAVTNPWHGLIWRDWRIVEVDGGHIGLITESGPWLYVMAAYSYSLLLAGTAILAFSLSQFGQHQKTVLAAVLAPLAGLLTNAFHLSPLNPAPWFDLTVVGFLIGVLIAQYGIVRRGVLNNVPIARDRVVEQLSDPVLVVNHKGTILDTNQAATDAWNRDSETLVQMSITKVVNKLPVERLMDPSGNSEVTINGRAYEVATTRLDLTDAHSDVALLFRDVTERRRAERELRGLKDELECMAHTDALTSMYNRRYFMQRLSEEFERGRRHGAALSVLIFDLDHFKRINDTYGHDQGDNVLVAVSEVVEHVKRLTDVACRLGGEEFALLLPETDRKGAIHLAQRLRRGIETFPYAQRCGRTMEVTASIGVATLSPRVNTPDVMLKGADNALYKAKHAGRNMVCVDGD